MSYNRTNRNGARVFIAAREPFNANGTFVGHGRNYTSGGRLPARYLDDYNTAQDADDFYVVMSYATPIAWYANGAWYVPNVRYSPTTQRHQNAMGLVKDGRKWHNGDMYVSLAAYVDA